MGFSTTNMYNQIQHFETSSAEEMETLIRQVPTVMKIISMYTSNGKHYCWFLSQTKIKKRGVKNATSR